MIRLCLVASILMLASSLQAQDSTKTVCDTAETTVAMRQCASRDLESVRRELDQYLAEARRVAANRAVVDSSQVAWQRYRDLACRAAAAEYEGGSMQPVVVLSCLTDLTRERIRQLYEGHLRMSDTALPEPKPQ
jgi:uncharacterized protein YecT (DUF1311 family)